MPRDTGDEGKKEDLWASILADVTSSTTSRHLQTKNLLVLGDEGSGKSNLIARLQGRKYNPEEHPLGTGLEYTYIDVRDEDSEDVLGRLGVYTLDGNEEHANLLQFVITKETVKDVLVVITLDMSRPWLMMESLKRWTKVLADHLDTLGAGPELDDLRAKLVRHFQTYSEGGASEGRSASAHSAASVQGEEAQGEEADAQARGGREEADAQARGGREESGQAGEAKEEETLLPLEEGVLTHNLGVPVIIMVTKSDSYVMLQKDRDYRNEHFDFVQLHLRKYALTHGAALTYTGKDGKNRDVLYRYVLHRVYGLPFSSKATIAGIDTVFIPSGWDNSTNISVLYDGLKSIRAEDPFEEHIKPPIKPKEAGSETVEVRDEQAFLKEQQALLGKSGGSSADGGVRIPLVRPTNETAAATSTPSSSAGGSTGASARARPAAAPAGAHTATAPAAPTAAAAGGDAKNTDVLANFFTSLLQKKPAAGGKKDEGSK